MFIAEALADFSSATMNFTQDETQKKQTSKAEKIISDQPQQKQQAQINDAIQEQSNQQNPKRYRSNSQEKKYVQEYQSNNIREDSQQAEQFNQEENQKVIYTSFAKGEKIIVKKTFDNGWWYGNPVKKPDTQGFFPSNYVRVGVQPPPPAPPKSKKQQSDDQAIVYNAEEHGSEKIRSEVDKMTQGPVKSDYYQGIKGYKMVKIDEKNQSILLGNHVQFDVNTNMARVPIKDQAPTSKAVRQMGYYFDYHQWNEQRNSNPDQRARPDPKKKKAKKLNLKMMNY